MRGIFFLIDLLLLAPRSEIPMTNFSRKLENRPQQAELKQRSRPSNNRVLVFDADREVAKTSGWPIRWNMPPLSGKSRRS